MSAFGAVTSIVHGDRDGGAIDDRGGVDRLCHAAYSGGYCTAKSPLDIVSITRRLLQNPQRQSMGGDLTLSLAQS